MASWGPVCNSFSTGSPDPIYSTCDIDPVRKACLSMSEKREVINGMRARSKKTYFFDNKMGHFQRGGCFRFGRFRNPRRKNKIRDQIRSRIWSRISPRFGRGFNPRPSGWSRIRSRISENAVADSVRRFFLMPSTVHAPRSSGAGA